jgi:hypothetical protein
MKVERALLSIVVFIRHLRAELRIMERGKIFHRVARNEKMKKNFNNIQIVVEKKSIVND